jgi:hypothetical protein
MKIFLSYASEDINEVAPTYYELINSGNSVFFDKKNLPPAKDFNSAIRKAVRECKLMIFFISPDSVHPASFTLTELKFAEEKWKHPKEHVLPVMIRDTKYETIPSYLKAVNILKPSGNTAAEVAAWVSGLQRKRIKVRVLLVSVALFLFGSLWVINNVAIYDKVVPILSYLFNKETIIERIYKFDGPFKVARMGDTLTFNLTDPIQDKRLSDKKVWIESVTVNSEVQNESKEDFLFDQELLVFSSPLLSQQRIMDGNDLWEYQRLKKDYAAHRRILRLTSKTDAGRAIHSKNPINWTVNMSDGSAINGSVVNVKFSPITVDSNGLYVQLFLWTEMSGEHFVEFGNIQVKLTIRVSSGSA